MKKKVLFFLPAAVLAITTFIWCFAKEGAYGLTAKPSYGSFSILSLAVPIFYFLALVVSLMRTADDDRGFYIKSSIVILVSILLGAMGLLLYPAFNAT